ncbi:tail protein X [Photobacterium leiognathi]|uniref:tail protein X n=1 Tax=Photobacterium leiognathi TaxID=553611 RepID=UPI00273A2739|nr:tail protein X [Photobacterium leiognathi]
MAKRYLTRDGDVLDAICVREYQTTDALMAVLDANPGLAEKGLVYPAGISIILPDWTPPSYNDHLPTLWS